MKKTIIIIFVGLLVIGVFAIGLTSTALAQDTQPPEEDTLTKDMPFVRNMDRMSRGRIPFGQTGLEIAAEQLGITSDELLSQLRAGTTLADLAAKAEVDLQTLRDAVENARIEDVKTKITEAVSEGELTQGEADWMLRGIENGYQQGAVRRGFGTKDNGDGLEAAANALGMDVQDLANQLWAGRTLAEIAENAGFELQTILDAMQSARMETARAQIEEALANGTITQEQADWMLEGLENGYGRAGMPGFDGNGSFGIGREGFGGRIPGGMRGCPNFQPPSQSEGE